MEIALGQRVVIKQSDSQFPLATVRWIGELPQKKGTWYGIVYDEPYGKHNGAFNGVGYFSCPAQYGSFVRETKIISELSLETAIKIQYTRDVTMEEIAGVTADSKVFFKDKPIDNLVAVSVNDLPIRKMTKGCLSNVCPRLKSFDCSNCPVESWDEIHNAVFDSHVTQITCSRMKPLFNTLNLVFDKVDTLSICKCGYSWAEVLRITQMFPNLKMLNVTGNKIGQFDSNTDNYRLPNGIQFIDFSENPISDFGALVKEVSHLSNLNELNLINCIIEDIPLIDQQTLPTLQTLVLAGNPMKSMSSFDAIHLCIPSLEYLSVRDTPLYSEDDETVKQEIIARIGNLKFLNRSKIPDTDADNAVNGLASRRGAEIDYLNRRAEAWENLDKNNVELTQKWNKDNPRWEALIKFHGDPIRIEKVDTTLNAKTIKIRLSTSEKEVEKELLKSTQVKMIYLMYKKMFKLKLKPGGLKFGVSNLVKMNWTLDDYGITENDVIELS